jgi:hypothetical protein
LETKCTRFNKAKNGVAVKKTNMRALGNFIKTGLKSFF